MSKTTVISIRIAGGRGADLRQRANAAGLPPATYARLLLESALEDKQRDEALRKFEEREAAWADQQRLFLAEIMKRLLQFRLIVADRKAPADALEVAAREVERIAAQVFGAEISRALGVGASHTTKEP
jgi:hypothetical protein